MNRIRSTVPVSVAALLIVVLAFSAAEAFESPPVTEPVRDTNGTVVGQAEIAQLGELEDPKINESSGLAFSRRSEDIIWTHNDSGDGPFLYAFDLAGRSRGTFAVERAPAYDWEDMAACEIDGVAHLIAADIGDNKVARDFCTLYIVEEPEVGADISHTGKLSIVRRIDFQYEDGKHDAEAIAVDADGASIYLITKKSKKNLPCHLYQLDIPSESTTNPVTARIVCEVDIRKVVAMDISRDGSRMIVLTYDEALEFERAPDESWGTAIQKPPRQLPMPWRAQGESICYGPDNDTLYLTSENTPAPIWRVRTAPVSPATAPAEENAEGAEPQPQP